MSKKRRRRDLTPDAIIHRAASDPVPDEFERQFAQAFVRLLATRADNETSRRHSIKDLDPTPQPLSPRDEEAAPNNQFPEGDQR